MARVVEARVGVHHGTGCTCKPLDVIEYRIQPVMVNDDCPVRTRPPETVAGEGRVVIVWPAAARGGAVSSLAVAFEDADTGEMFTDVTEFTITARAATGAAGTTTVDLVRLLHTDGTPLRDRKPMLVDGEIPTGVFRHVLAEMRIAEPRPSNPVDGGC